MNISLLQPPDLPRGGYSHLSRTSWLSTFKKENIEWSADRVIYADFSINQKERLEDFAKNHYRKFFWKDKYFEYQREFRVIVLNRDSDERIIYNIGDFLGCSFITETERLLNDEFYLKMSIAQKEEL